MIPANRSKLNGLVIAVIGIVVAGLGLLILSSVAGGTYFSEACLVLTNTVSICTSPRTFVGFAFYFGTAGSAFVVLGGWRAGLGNVGIVQEGAGLVIATGIAVLGVGFFTLSALAYPGYLEYALALFGNVLLMGGVLKFGIGEKRVQSVRLGEVDESLEVRDPRAWQVFMLFSALGIVGTIVSGWLVSYEIVTPGGGGVYWGFPFAWKSIQGWLGTFEGFQYDWFWFIIDSLIYTAAGYCIIFFLWFSLAPSRKAQLVKYLESRKTIVSLAMVVVVLFITNLAYDYVYLRNLWG